MFFLCIEYQGQRVNTSHKEVLNQPSRYVQRSVFPVLNRVWDENGEDVRPNRARGISRLEPLLRRHIEYVASRCCALHSQTGVEEAIVIVGCMHVVIEGRCSCNSDERYTSDDLEENLRCGHLCNRNEREFTGTCRNCVILFRLCLVRLFVVNHQTHVAYSWVGHSHVSL